MPGHPFGLMPGVVSLSLSRKRASLGRKRASARRCSVKTSVWAGASEVGPGPRPGSEGGTDGPVPVPVTMAVFHDEVEIEDFQYDEDSETYFYPCPCGDNFCITKVTGGSSERARVRSAEFLPLTRAAQSYPLPFFIPSEFSQSRYFAPFVATWFWSSVKPEGRGEGVDGGEYQSSRQPPPLKLLPRMLFGERSVFLSSGCVCGGEGGLRRLNHDSPS